MLFKTCCECNLQLRGDQFKKLSKAKDGLNYKCKSCCAQHRRDNLEHFTAIDKASRDRHKEKRNEKSKAYYQEHKEQKKIYDAQYYASKRKKHGPKKLKFKRTKADINYRIRVNISRSISGKLRNNNSSKNGKSILDVLPYTMQELRNHLESQFEAWMNWQNYGVYRVSKWNDNEISTWTWNIDHIIPHSLFNYTSMTDQSFQDCWSLSNLRPLNSKQNLLDGVSKIRHNK